MVNSNTFNEEYIKKCREKDINDRGSDHIVYNYFGQLQLLKDTEIWYNNKYEYVKPKSYTIESKKNIKKNKSCIIS